ncbi:Alpha/Beta hydrolase protein [Phlyctochytrium arcticum]|nr:Alpha/Beta hydrolase protein [Phlyctochytrium arcticum]
MKWQKTGPGAFPALQIHYWRNVKDALRDLGCNIAVARVGTVAALKTRAFELRTFLERNMEGQRVNLVAHSMGGLDCRYLISHLPYSGFSINSVTTVATPHRGSSFMDWCRDAMGLGVLQDYVSKQVDDVVAKHLSVAHPTSPLLSSSERETIRRAHPLVRAICAPIDSPGFANLTREYCAAFNELTPDDPRIYYSSYAAVSDVSVLSPLHFSWRVVRQKEGENDGLVSLDSARWGEFLGTLDADHWQLIPPRSPIKAALSRVSGGTSFDSVGFYLRLVTKLADRGF